MQEIGDKKMEAIGDMYGLEYVGKIDIPVQFFVNATEKLELSYHQQVWYDNDLNKYFCSFQAGLLVTLVYMAHYCIPLLLIQILFSPYTIQPNHYERL